MENISKLISNLLTLSVRDEGYSRNVSCALNLIFITITGLIPLLVDYSSPRVVNDGLWEESLVFSVQFDGMLGGKVEVITSKVFWSAP